jgi:hypothetical protein
LDCEAQLWGYEHRLKYLEIKIRGMELNPRQVSFLKEKMGEIENDETCQPTARVEAGRIREKAETEITE